MSKRLNIESLEDRVTPSTSVTIMADSLTGPEGSPVALTSVVDGANGTPTYDWSVVKVGDSTPFATGADANFTFTPDDNGSYVVTLNVTDADNTNSDSKTFDITNVAPTATLSGPTAGVRSQTLSFTLGASDPSSVDQAADFTYQIDWNGDGTVDETVTGPAGTVVNHAFSTEGTNNVTVTATDKDDGVSEAVSQGVTIKAVALVQDPSTGEMVLEIGGTAKNDFILVNPGGGKTGGLRVFMNGKSQGIFTGADRIEVFGGDGNDNIQIAGSIALDATLDGGNGNDRLKGAKGNDVLIGGAGRDWLMGDQGDDMLLGGDDNDYLNGAQGNDVLVGGGGKDFMIGGFGNDIMIGGDGADNLNGGPGDDLMVGASTALDDDQEALKNLADVWNGSGTTGDHVAAIRTSGELSTITDDGVRDVFVGASGTNWFITDSSLDRILGNVKTSFVNDGDPVPPPTHGNSGNGHGGNGK